MSQSTFVTCESNQSERRRIIEEFSSGPSNEPKVLVNVGILTEGTDIPSIHTVVMTRPTARRSRGHLASRRTAPHQ